MSTQFRKGIGSFARSKQGRALSNLESDIEAVQNLKVYDALIIDQDPDYIDKYKIDVFESGFDHPPTIRDMDAIAPSAGQYLDKWAPCRIVIGRQNTGIILRQSSLSYMLLKEEYPPYNQGTYYPNKLTGWPAGLSSNSNYVSVGSWIQSGYAGQDTSISINIIMPIQTTGINFIAPSSFRGYGGTPIPWMNYDVPLTIPKTDAVPSNNFYQPPTPAFPAVPEWRAQGYMIWKEPIPKGEGIGKVLQIMDAFGGYGWDYPVFV